MSDKSWMFENILHNLAISIIADSNLELWLQEACQINHVCCHNLVISIIADCNIELWLRSLNLATIEQHRVRTEVDVG